MRARRGAAGPGRAPGSSGPPEQFLHVGLDLLRIGVDALQPLLDDLDVLLRLPSRPAIPLQLLLHLGLLVLDVGDLADHVATRAARAHDCRHDRADGAPRLRGHFGSIAAPTPRWNITSKRDCTADD